MVLFYIWSAGDVVFSVKNIVQSGNELNHKTALKFSQKYHCRPKLYHLDSEITIPWADYTFSGPCRLKKTPWTSKVADQTTNQWCF